MIIRQLEATGLPKSSALGLFGIPGLTAYLGLMEIGKPKVILNLILPLISHTHQRRWWITRNNYCCQWSFLFHRPVKLSLSVLPPARWVTSLDRLQSISVKRVFLWWHHSNLWQNPWSASSWLHWWRWQSLLDQDWTGQWSFSLAVSSLNFGVFSDVIPFSFSRGFC